MMTMVAFSGLVVTAQLSPIAKFYNVDKVIVVFGMSAMVLAIEVDQVLNGFSRPFWGWVSDHVGRENTMFVAFSLEALAVFGLLRLIHRPIWFILMSGFVFLRLGRDLLAVPLHYRRPFWQDLGDHQLRHCLYQQGIGVDFRRPGCRPGVHQDGQLGAGLLGDDCL